MCFNLWSSKGIFGYLRESVPHSWVWTSTEYQNILFTSAWGRGCSVNTEEWYMNNKWRTSNIKFKYTAVPTYLRFHFPLSVIYSQLWSENLQWEIPRKKTSRKFWIVCHSEYRDEISRCPSLSNLRPEASLGPASLHCIRSPPRSPLVVMSSIGLTVMVSQCHSACVPVTLVLNNGPKGQE